VSDDDGFAWRHEAEPPRSTRSAPPRSERSERPRHDSRAPEEAGAEDKEALTRRIRELEAQVAALEAQPRPRSSRPRGTPPERDSRAITAASAAKRRALRGPPRQAPLVDDFGLDRGYEARLVPALDFALERYLRLTVEGVDHVPNSGPCLVVANHAGGPVPYDGLLLRSALRLHHPARRELRWLSEDHVHHLPFVGSFFARLGAVRACPENASRLLADDLVVAVFPEGAQGSGRLFKERHRLARLGRGGFVRLCLRTQTPLVTAALVGPDEASPLLYKVEVVARSLGIPYLPITPTFPWLGPLGLLPLPVRCRLRFGPLVSFEGYPPEAGDDERLVARLADEVRGGLQTMLDELRRG
jgi:1-acyl-sn-glycerol-3-phosphate acyltransferase